MERGATAPLGNLTAVAMEVKGDTTIQAEGKANYWAAHNQTRTLDESTTSRSLLGHEYKSSTQHQDGGSRSALVTSIQSEGNILSDSTGDSTLQGTRLQSGGHVQLQSGASIHLQTADGQSYQTTWQERSNLIEEGGAKPVIHYHDHDETGSQSSSVDGVAIQGNSITLIAQTGDIDGKAIDFHAKNGIHLQAGGHILIDTGEEHDVRWHQNQTAQTGHTTLHTGGRAHFDGVTRMGHDDLRTDSSTRVKASTLDAGAGHLTTISGGDTVILGSDLKAQGGIDLHAQGKLILGGHQENQSQGDTTNTGTFIGKARDGHDYQDSATTSRASRLDSGGKIHLKGEEQLILGNVELTSVGKTHLDTPHLVVSPESQLNQHNTEDWDKDRGYRTERGQGKADESLVYGKINAGGGLQIDPGTHISVGIDTGKTGADGQAVQLSAPQYQRIAEQLGQQPGLGYLKDLAGRSDIDWQAVGTAHQQWDYKGQGMTQEGAIVLTIVIAIVTSGAGASAVGTEGAATTSIAADGAVATSATTTFGGTALSTTTTTVAADGVVTASTTYTAAGAAFNAGFTSLATSAAISLANNGGDIGKTLHELGKSDTIKSTATAMITAGLLDAQIFGEADQARSLNQIANTNTVQGLGSVAKFDWNTLGQNFAGMAGRSTISAGVSSIIQGGDFEDNLRNNLINDLAAVGANAIGTKWGSGSTDKNPFLQTAAHGVLGCAVAGARGGDCKSGAVGGMTESVLGNVVSEFGGLSSNSQLARGLYTGAAVITSSVIVDELDLNIRDATSAAQNAATNNFLGHIDQARRDQLRAKGDKRTASESAELVRLEASDQLSDGLLNDYRSGIYLTDTERRDLSIYLGHYEGQDGAEATTRLVQNGPNPTYTYPYAGRSKDAVAYMEKIRADSGWGPVLSWFASRGEASSNEQTYLAARTDSGLFWNTAPNESFLPSNQSAQELFSELDALRNSTLATAGYVGATVADADPSTRRNLALGLSGLSDIGSSFILPKTGISPVFGKTTVDVVEGGVGVDAAWKGAGPVPGTFGVSPTTTSVKGLQNYYPKKGAVEFIFDPVSSTFVVSNGTMKHSPLASSIGADTNQVVGGIFTRGPNGSIMTNEFSGHFWQNWTPQVRQQFLDFMNSKGLNVIHQEGM